MNIKLVANIMYLSLCVGITDTVAQVVPVKTIHIDTQNDILAADLSNNGDVVATGGNGFLKAHNPISGLLIREYDVGPIEETDVSAFVHGLSMSPDASRMIAMMRGLPMNVSDVELNTPLMLIQHLVVFDFHTGEVLHYFESRDRYNYGYTSSAFSFDGSTYIAGDGLEIVEHRDSITGRLINQHMVVGSVGKLGFVDRDSFYCYNGSSISTYDLHSGDRLNVFLGSPYAVSGDGKWTLVNNHYLNTHEPWELYDNLTGALIRRFSLGGGEWTGGPVALSPWGRNFLLGQGRLSDDTELKPRKLFDAENENLLRQYPTAPVNSAPASSEPDRIIQYFPDGRRFFTANGGDIHIWDISDVVPAVEDAQLHGQ